MIDQKKCLCQSGKLRSECCAVFFEKPHLAAPQELMRSRYTALAEGRYQYFIDTQRLLEVSTIKDLQHSQQGITWVGLKVMREKILDSDHAVVEFVANYRVAQSVNRLHEVSHFRRVDGQWFYVDALQVQLSSGAKCFCGSGRKYKKCCKVIEN